MTKLYVLNGPNLNLLGQREPDHYGHISLAEIEAQCLEMTQANGLELVFRQTNSEGTLVDWIQEAGLSRSPVVLNPGAYTHTSIALRDAISGSSAKVVEVHLSNVFARETFRHHSYVSPVAVGVICGFGATGYAMAIQAVLSRQV